MNEEPQATAAQLTAADIEFFAQCLDRYIAQVRAAQTTFARGRVDVVRESMLGLRHTLDAILIDVQEALSHEDGPIS